MQRLEAYLAFPLSPPFCQNNSRRI